MILWRLFFCLRCQWPNNLRTNLNVFITIKTGSQRLPRYLKAYTLHLTQCSWVRSQRHKTSLNLVSVCFHSSVYNALWLPWTGLTFVFKVETYNSTCKLLESLIIHFHWQPTEFLSHSYLLISSTTSGPLPKLFGVRR